MLNAPAISKYGKANTVFEYHEGHKRRGSVQLMEAREFLEPGSVSYMLQTYW